jgi:hypothetical protein
MGSFLLLERNFQAGFQGMQRGMLFCDLPAPLNAVAPTGDQKPPGKPCGKVPEDRSPHRWIENSRPRR